MAVSVPTAPTASMRPDAESTPEPTLLRVDVGASGRLRVRSRAGLLVPRLVRISGAPRAQVAHVVLVAAGALLLAGDALALDVRVGPGARLVLEDVAATIAYDARGGRASWSARLDVAAEAELRWHGEPFVVADGADVDRRLDADVATGGQLMLRDTLVLGRHGEVGGAVCSRTRIAYGGRPVLAEDLRLGPATTGAAPLRDLPGILDGARVLDQLLHIGPEPGREAGQALGREAGQALGREAGQALGREAGQALGRAGGPGPDGGAAAAPRDGVPGVLHTRLHHGGTLTRWLGDQTHRSPLRATWPAAATTGQDTGDDTAARTAGPQPS